MSFFPLILYLVCVFIRPQDWVPGFLGKPIVSILSAVIFGLLFIERFGNAKTGFAKVPQNRLMVGLYLSIVLSHISHTYLAAAIDSFKVFSVTFILYFLILNGINKKWKFKIAVWVIVGLITSLVFQGMYQIEHGYGWAEQDLLVYSKEDLSRITWVGIFSDPNDLALAFVIAVGIVIAFIFGSAASIFRFVSAVSICYLFYGIYLTNSRGGLLALMATVYFYFVRRTGKILWGGIIGGVLAFLILVFGPSRAGLITVSEASAFSRVELWYNGLQMLKTNPLFGRGFGMFLEDLPQTAHNSYILAAAELGFIGYFFWLGLLYTSFTGMSAIQKADKSLSNYALGLQSGIVGFCAAACFLSRTYVIIPYLLCALSGSLMSIAREQNPELDFKLTKSDVRNIIFLCIGSLLLFLAVIKIGL